MSPVKHAQFEKNMHHGCVERAGQMEVQSASLRWDDEIRGLILQL